MGRSSKKIPSTSAAAPDAEAVAAALAEADRLRRMNTFQWLGLQTELAVERGLDMCAPGRAARAPPSARCQTGFARNAAAALRARPGGVL